MPRSQRSSDTSTTPQMTAYENTLDALSDNQLKHNKKYLHAIMNDAVNELLNEGLSEGSEQPEGESKGWLNPDKDRFNVSVHGQFEKDNVKDSLVTRLEDWMPPFEFSSWALAWWKTDPKREFRLKCQRAIQTVKTVCQALDQDNPEQAPTRQEKEAFHLKVLGRLSTLTPTWWQRLWGEGEEAVREAVVDVVGDEGSVSVNKMYSSMKAGGSIDQLHMAYAEIAQQKVAALLTQLQDLQNLIAPEGKTAMAVTRIDNNKLNGWCVEHCKGIDGILYGKKRNKLGVLLCIKESAVTQEDRKAIAASKDEGAGQQAMAKVHEELKQGAFEALIAVVQASQPEGRFAREDASLAKDLDEQRYHDEASASQFVDHCAVYANTRCSEEYRQKITGLINIWKGELGPDWSIPEKSNSAIWKNVKASTFSQAITGACTAAKNFFKQKKVAFDPATAAENLKKEEEAERQKQAKQQQKAQQAFEEKIRAVEQGSPLATLREKRSHKMVLSNIESGLNPAVTALTSFLDRLSFKEEHRLLKACLQLLGDCLIHQAMSTQDGVEGQPYKITKTLFTNALSSYAAGLNYTFEVSSTSKLFGKSDFEKTCALLPVTLEAYAKPASEVGAKIALFVKNVEGQLGLKTASIDNAQISEINKQLPFAQEKNLEKLTGSEHAISDTAREKIIDVVGFDHPVLVSAMQGFIQYLLLGGSKKNLDLAKSALLATFDGLKQGGELKLKKWKKGYKGTYHDFTQVLPDTYQLPKVTHDGVLGVINDMRAVIASYDVKKPDVSYGKLEQFFLPTAVLTPVKKQTDDEWESDINAQIKDGKKVCGLDVQEIIDASEKDLLKGRQETRYAEAIVANGRGRYGKVPTAVPVVAVTVEEKPEGSEEEDSLTI